ncbi:hypothetical protein Tco_1367858 [Tanacetum coccineum]
MKMIEQYKDFTDGTIPDEFKDIVKMIIEDPSMIAMFKKDFYVEVFFIYQESDAELQTPVTNSLTKSKFSSLDKISFNFEETPNSVKGTQSPVLDSRSKDHSDGV